MRQGCIRRPLLCALRLTSATPSLHREQLESKFQSFISVILKMKSGFTLEIYMIYVYTRDEDGDGEEDAGREINQHGKPRKVGPADGEVILVTLYLK